jgi:hypothetical protein
MLLLKLLLSKKLAAFPIPFEQNKLPKKPIISLALKKGA